MPPVPSDAVVGEIVMELTVGAVTVIAADADLELSATLVAVTVAVPAVDAAV
jgi:hypothetical protein